MAKKKNPPINKSNSIDNTDDTANAAGTGALAAPSEAMKQLFAAPTQAMESLLSKAERRNAPKMYKPDDVPVGGVVSGEIIRFIQSPVSTVKGKLIWLKLLDGTEITFPLTGVIRVALNEDPDKEIGKILIIKRAPDGASAKYKNKMFVFDVFTIEKKEFLKLNSPA